MEVKLAFLTLIGKIFNKTSEERLQDNFFECLISVELNVLADLPENGGQEPEKKKVNFIKNF